MNRYSKATGGGYPAGLAAKGIMMLLFTLPVNWFELLSAVLLRVEL